jgi:hypothetical protein
MTIRYKRVLTAAVLVLLAFAVTRAATKRYEERQDAFRAACKVEREKLGLSDAELRAKYPTPEIHLMAAACIQPGATAEVVVNGRFSPGAKIFVQNDNFEVVKESVQGNQYRMTVKAAPGIGPEDAALVLMNPVTAASARVETAVRTAGRFEWNMTAANGWKVVARPRSTDSCPEGDAALRYDVSFFRQGETAAFEKAAATLVFLPSNKRNYRFDLIREHGAPAGFERYQAAMKRMIDPNVSEEERQQIMLKLPEIQKEYAAAMAKMTDPAYFKQQAAEQERREQEFGCRSIELTAEASKLTGDMFCAAKVGRPLPVTGTVGPIK